MSDLIERDTILAFVRRCKDRLQGKGLTYDMLVDYVESIPSAERKGEWIYTDNPLRLDDEWVCSRCGNISFARTNFCDRCGARMKGADDE